MRGFVNLYLKEVKGKARVRRFRFFVLRLVGSRGELRLVMGSCIFFMATAFG